MATTPKTAAYAAIVAGKQAAAEAAARAAQAANAAKRATATAPVSPTSISGNPVNQGVVTGGSNEEVKVNIGEYRSTGDPALDAYYIERMQQDPDYARKILENQKTSGYGTSSMSMTINPEGTINSPVPSPVGLTPPAINDPMRERAIPSSEVGATPDGTEEFRMPETMEYTWDENTDKNFFESLGMHKNYVLGKVQEFENKTGTKVFSRSPDFQKKLKQQLGNERNWEKLFMQFSVGWEPGTKPLPTRPTKSTTEISKIQADPSSEDDPYINKIATILNDEGSKTLHEQLEAVLAFPVNTPGEAMLRNILMLTLGTIDDPETAEYLDYMTSRAEQSYLSGISMAEKSMAELEKAMNGTLDAPETSAGLMAKIFQEGKEEQLQYLESEKQYYQQRGALVLRDLRNKRADLEGYAKAKLYSIGAQDSSAGVSLVSKVLSEADLNIAMVQLEYDHAQSQLNAQGRNIISTYTNNVAQLYMGIEEQKSAILGEYNSAIDSIVKDKLTSRKEQRVATLQAFTGYMRDLQSLQAKQDEAAQKELEDAYKKSVDLRDWAYKVSGMTGEIYVPDENGNLVNTGLPTFAAKQFESTNDRLLMQMDISADANRRQWADMLLDNYGSSAAPMVEQILGMAPGSLGGIETIAEMRNAIAASQDALSWAKFQSDNGLIDYNSSVLETYRANGGGIKPGGIGIDPMSLPDVRSNILGSSTVTQSFKKDGTGGTDTGGGHGGIDVVFKDGYVHALRGGTVVDIIPWDGVNPYGARVLVQDETGLIWQYGHLGSRTKQGNPFAVSLGQKVGAMEVLGKQGNTGRVLSKKNPNDPTYGVHVDIRIVGKITGATTLGSAAARLLKGEQPFPTSLASLITEYEKTMGKIADDKVKQYLQKYGQEGLKTLTGGNKSTGTISLAD